MRAYVTCHNDWILPLLGVMELIANEYGRLERKIDRYSCPRGTNLRSCCCMYNMTHPTLHGVLVLTNCQGRTQCRSLYCVSWRFLASGQLSDGWWDWPHSIALEEFLIGEHGAYTRQGFQFIDVLVASTCFPQVWLIRDGKKLLHLQKT
jgi:hypothetical protein